MQPILAPTRRAVLATAVVLLAARATAQPAPEIEVRAPWARATANPGGNGAAYLTLVERGAADRLVAARSPVARLVELHTHLMVGDIMQMRPVPAIEVTPTAPTTLTPSGLHIMLIGLAAPLRQGESFPLTLRFERAGELTIQVPVGGPGAMGPPPPAPPPPAPR